MEFNFLIVALAALVPLVMGFIWYNPKVFGTAWMNSLGFTEENLKGGNMLMIFGLSFIFSFLLAFVLQTFVIHQWGVASTLMNEPGFGEQTGEAYSYFTSFLETYGGRFRTFQHGAFHGVLYGLFVALPIIGINSMFERRKWKNIWINVGYWTVTLAIMGGILSKWA